MKNGRRKGHEWERALARYLTEHWLPRYLDTIDGWILRGYDIEELTIVSARKKGAHVGEDLVLELGPEAPEWRRLPVAIEAKNADQQRVEAWLDQAERQADGLPYVVISKWAQHSTGEARVIWRYGDGFAECQLDTWIDNFNDWYRNRAYRPHRNA